MTRNYVSIGMRLWGIVIFAATVVGNSPAYSWVYIDQGTTLLSPLACNEVSGSSQVPLDPVASAHAADHCVYSGSMYATPPDAPACGWKGAGYPPSSFTVPNTCYCGNDGCFQCLNSTFSLDRTTKKCTKQEPAYQVGCRQGRSLLSPYVVAALGLPGVGSGNSIYGWVCVDTAKPIVTPAGVANYASLTCTTSHVYSGGSATSLPGYTSIVKGALGGTVSGVCISNPGKPAVQ